MKIKKIKCFDNDSLGFFLELLAKEGWKFKQATDNDPKQWDKEFNFTTQENEFIKHKYQVNEKICWIEIKTLKDIKKDIKKHKKCIFKWKNHLKQQKGAKNEN